MKLKAKERDGSMFVKFEKIGDSCVGEFVEFNQGVPSKFGDEDQLILRGDNGPLMVRCTKKLSSIIADNIDAIVPGSRMTITFTKEIDTGKGNPMKDYDVDVEPPTPEAIARQAATSEAIAAANENIPF